VAEDERWIGAYIVAPGADGTTWTITDIRTGESTDTDAIGGGPFPGEVAPLPVSFGIGDLGWQLVRFDLPDADPADSPAATPVGTAQSVTLVFPGSLADARFLPYDIAPSYGLHSTAAFAWPGDGDPLLASVTDDPGARVRVENAVTGETVAVFSDTEIGADGPLQIAGFDDDDSVLIVWSLGTVSRLSLDGGEDITQFEVTSGWIDSAFLGNGTLLARVNPFYDAPEDAADWRLLDFDTGAWRPLPELDGYRYDRVARDRDIIVLSARDGIETTGFAMVDLTSGKTLAGVPDADVGAETARTISRDGHVFVVTGHTGDEQTTGYVLDAASGESWRIEPPSEGQVWYGVSPDGSLLTASTDAGDGWVAPVAAGTEWTKLPEGRIVDWLWLPEGD
jgi:hypothetical protein